MSERSDMPYLSYHLVFPVDEEMKDKERNARQSVIIKAGDQDIRSLPKELYKSDLSPFLPHFTRQSFIRALQPHSGLMGP